LHNLLSPLARRNIGFYNYSSGLYSRAGTNDPNEEITN
jgi:hypothetical protein